MAKKVLNLPYFAPVVDPKTGNMTQAWQNAFSQNIIPAINDAGGATPVPGSTVWGSITGSINNQADLLGALASKQANLGFTPINKSGDSGIGSLVGTSFNGITGLGVSTPLMDGIATPGTATLVSREDHIHPRPTVAVTAPITGDGTVGNPLVIAAATTSIPGYLTATDWNTFNGKQAAYTNLTSIGSLANTAGLLRNNGSGTFSYDTTTYLSGTKVDSFNTRTGAVTLSSSDVTTALTYTPYNATNPSGYTTNVGTVTSVTAGNGMTQSGTSTVNPTLDVVSHAGSAGTVGTLAIAADSIGVSLGSTSTTACSGADSRLSDARTPTAHNQALTTITTAITAGTLLKSDGSNPVASSITETIVNANTAKVTFPGFTATATDIKMNGIQAVGVSTLAPRADHVHPTDTSRVATTVTISTTAPLTGGGDLSANRTFAMAAATTSVPGYLTAADWTTFNGKQDALGFTPINKAGDTGIGNLSMGAMTATSGSLSGTLAIAYANPDVSAITISATTTTNAVGMKLTNGGGNYYIGSANSTGGRLFGGGNYAFSIGTESAIPLVFATNNTLRLSISGAGVASFQGNAVSMGALTATSGEFSVASSSLVLRLRRTTTSASFTDMGTDSVVGFSLWSDGYGTTSATPVLKIAAGPTGAATFGGAVFSGALTATTVKASTAAGFISSDGSTGFTGTVTTSSLVGKTITIKDGIITGFA